MREDKTFRFKSNGQDYVIRVTYDTPSRLIPIPIKRFFLEHNGEEIELYVCSDCELHLVSGDECFDFCALPYGDFKIEPRYLKRVGKMKICKHVCAHKKQKFREMLNKVGSAIEQEKREWIEAYLKSPITN